MKVEEVARGVETEAISEERENFYSENEGVWVPLENLEGDH